MRVSFLALRFFSDLAAFKEAASLIVTNRMHSDLDDVGYKVYTRDLFGEN